MNSKQLGYHGYLRYWLIIFIVFGLFYLFDILLCFPEIFWEIDYFNSNIISNHLVFWVCNNMIFLFYVIVDLINEIHGRPITHVREEKSEHHVPILK